MSEKYVIITAGGSGERMGGIVPKQFLLLNGLPVIMHSILPFKKYSSSINIIVVLPLEHIQSWEKLCKEYKFEIKHSVYPGGESRFHSVKNGLDLINSEGLVAVHDAVRPLVSSSLITRCFDEAARMGNAVPAIPLTDSAREVIGGENHPIDRNKIRLIQTPQVFNVETLKQAYTQSYQPFFTDDASVVEAMGQAIHLVEGEVSNIKITRPEDLRMASAMITSPK